MDESQSILLFKKIRHKHYVLYDSIFMNFQNQQDYSMVIEVRKCLFMGIGKLVMGMRNLLGLMKMF